MAKITAYGYHEIARWKRGEDTRVLRSDGSLLAKYGSRGAYTVLGRVRGTDGRPLTAREAKTLSQSDWNDIVERLTNAFGEHGWTAYGPHQSTRQYGHAQRNSEGWHRWSVRQRNETRRRNRGE